MMQIQESLNTSAGEDNFINVTNTLKRFLEILRKFLWGARCITSKNM